MGERHELADPRELAARQAYLGLGAGRDLKVLAKEIGLPLRTLRAWRKAEGWDGHAATYDEKSLALTQQNDVAARTAQWARVRDEHLTVAGFLRGKALEYFAEREIEQIEDAKGRMLRPGMDPQLARLALDMLKYADQTERLDLGEPTERTAVQGQDGKLAISVESMQLQIHRALEDVKNVRVSQGLPALSDPKALGDYEL